MPSGESVSHSNLTLGGDPQVLFMDYKYRELEKFNITDYKSEDIAKLIISKGFKEENITQDHPIFVKEREFHNRIMESLTEEEKKLIEEKNELVFQEKATGKDAQMYSGTQDSEKIDHGQKDL